MAISLVSGSSVNLPLPFNSVRFLTTAIVAEMSYSQGLHREVLFTVGLVLFAFIMFINTVLTGCSRKEGRKMTSNLSIYNRKVRTSDQVLKGLIYLAAAATISLLVGIMGYVFIRGLPRLSWQFLSTVQSARKGTFGILGNIVNTLYIIVITLIIAAPVGDWLGDISERVCKAGQAGADD